MGAFFFAACGDTILPSTGCTNDASCDTSKNELCHPTAKVCVQACNMGSDCPDSAKNCQAISATNSAKTCQCATDALCGTGKVCQPYGVCTDKCSGASDCPSGYTCDTAAGRCTTGGGNTDAGMDGGNNTCTFGSCNNTQICTANGCATVICSASNDQPDVCGYGNKCNVAACAEVEKGMCTNFPAGTSPTTWNPFGATASTGPVIFDSEEPTDDAAACKTTAVAYSVRLKVYRTDADWPSMVTAIPSIKYYDSTGATTNVVGNLIRPSNYMPDAKEATLLITVCRTGSATGSITAGFAFDNGNPVCVTLNQGTVGTAP